LPPATSKLFRRAKSDSNFISNKTWTPCGRTVPAASNLQYNECVCPSDFTPRHTDNTDYTSPPHLISSDEVYMQFAVWGRRLSTINGQSVVLTGVKILAIVASPLRHNAASAAEVTWHKEGVTAASTDTWLSATWCCCALQ
jgi:hypothetical protein